MKKILITFLALGFLFTSCEFDKGFEEMNINPNAAAQIDAANKFTYLLTKVSGERYENWRNSMIYNSAIVQHHADPNWWAGDTYNRNDQWTFALWERGYPQQVKNIEDILDQLRKDGDSGTNMGIARILRAFIYHRLTDLYGDVPYSEAGQGYINGTLKPKYDAQQDIYMDMLKELEEAVSQIGSDSSWGSADVVFGGSAAHWKAFGNSLMLRLAMRLTAADAATAQAWAVKAIGAGTMTSNDHIAAIKHGDGNSGSRNGHGEVFLADQGSRISTSFMSRMDGDPRKTRLFMRASDKSQNVADLIGIRNGLKGESYTDLDGNTVPARGDTSVYAMAATELQSITAPMVMQTYAEVEFLKAEAAIRGWISASDKAHYEAGVTAGMKMLSQLYPDMTAITDAEISTFLAGPGAYKAGGSVAERWEQVMDQYWIATYFNEYEAYSNWRRSGFPAISPTRHPDSYTAGRFMIRMLYPTSESSNNAENYAAAVARQGADEYTTPVWWDK
tara:strand:+ start:2924 stop:4435 length:1512 start_codon:yes stop_codon:yes gene_type:complete